MPAILGPFQIGNVTGGVVQFGDTAFVSPKNSINEMFGAASGVTGVAFAVNSGISNNFTCENQIANQPIVGNN
ncbi:putative spore germination protein GerPF [Heyndrickxia sporothermodurans]|nr:putative spore germination protein GerPF [Heyndrickxia sporothermodurans]